MLCGNATDAYDDEAEIAKLPMTEDDMMLQRFYKHVKERPDDIYLTQPIEGQETPNTYTWKQVHDEASKMASYLNTLGLEKNSKIAIVSKNCAHFFMAELAIWMSGNTTVALFPNLSSSTCEYIFGHSEAKLLFIGKVEPSWDEMKKGVPDGITKVGFPQAPSGDEYETWSSIIEKNEPLPDQPTRAYEDEALIVYTSGSTGTPKGVLHNFRTISEPAKKMVALHKITPADRYLSYLPIAHVFDRFLALCCSLYAGSKIWFAESIHTFVQDLQRARPTLFVSVPRLWLKFQLGVYSKMPKKKFDMLMSIPLINRLIAKKVVAGLGLDSVRLAASGSAPIPGELLVWYRNLGLCLLEGYGMSENFCYSHSTLPGKERVGYIGNCFPGVECKLSEEGEILVKSPGTMVGYYKAPDLTAEVMTDDGYLKTGDRGEIDNQGRLKITGRTKELFKTSKGKYVAPVPIENILNNDHNIEQSVVGGSGQVSTMALIQLSEDLDNKLKKGGDDAEKEKKRITTEMEALLSKVNGQIEEYEKVGFLCIVKDRWTIEDELLTPTMKIKRSAIENKYDGQMEGWYESKTKIIWEE